MVRPLRQLSCWHCGYDVEERETICPHCRAALDPTDRSPRLTRPRLPRPDDAVMPMIWVFVAMLGVSVVYGIIAISMARKGGATNEQQFGMTLLVEGIDTLLVVLAVCLLPRPPAPPRVEPLIQGLTWGFAAPLLLILLGINSVYHHFLQSVLGDGGEGDLTLGRDKFSPLLILIICVQPAIIEELYFRHLALGLLRKQMGVHGAVLVSSVMFAVSHLFAPLSMPVLGLLGMAFGYVRIYSRSLVLPMLMHFLHNFAVILLGSS